MINKYLVELFGKIEMLLAIFTGIFFLLVIPTASQYGADKVPGWALFIGFVLVEIYLIFPGKNAMKQQEAKLFTMKWIKHVLNKTKTFTCEMAIYTALMMFIVHKLPPEQLDKDLYWFFSEESFLIWLVVSVIGFVLLPSDKSVERMLEEYYNKH